MSKPTIRLSVAERQLKSGLTLLSVHNPGAQTYACVTSLDVRIADEDPRYPGVASMVGECLDEGTSKYGALELATAVESLGAMMEGRLREAGLLGRGSFLGGSPLPRRGLLGGRCLGRGLLFSEPPLFGEPGGEGVGLRVVLRKRPLNEKEIGSGEFGVISRGAHLTHTHTLLSRSTSFLSGDYEAKRFWWEPVEMCRKLALTGWVLLIPEEFEKARALTAILVSVTSLTLRALM